MDFKVAGTREFVTALQLDTKLDGIPAEVLAAALTQAKDARLAILDVMAEAIDAPEEMSIHAPRIITIRIPVDKIGEVIGPKGKVINQIQDDTGAPLTIEDDGTIYIGATNGEAAEAARAAVNAIANPTMPEVGERYLGTVVKTTNFGAFVSLLPGQGRPAAHQQAARPGRRQARRDRRGRRLGGPEDPGPDRRDRRPRQAVADPGRRGGRRLGRRRAPRPTTPSDLSVTEAAPADPPADRSGGSPCFTRRTRTLLHRAGRATVR